MAGGSALSLVTAWQDPVGEMLYLYIGFLSEDPSRESPLPGNTVQKRANPVTRIFLPSDYAPSDLILRVPGSV